MTRKDEERIRRAIRYFVRCSRTQDGQPGFEYVFDLLPYLRPEAGAVVEDETARALAELVGGS